MLCPLQGDNQLYIVLATATYNKRTHKMYYEWYIVLDIYVTILYKVGREDQCRKGVFSNRRSLIWFFMKLYICPLLINIGCNGI